MSSWGVMKIGIEALEGMGLGGVGWRYRGTFLCQRYERHGMRACGGLTNDETNHVYQPGMVEVGYRCKDGDLTNNVTFVRPVRLVSTVHTQRVQSQVHSSN